MITKMTLKEREEQLKNDILLFNKTFVWWTEEVEKALIKLQELEEQDAPEEKAIPYIKKLKYLQGKGCSEEQTANLLAYRLYKLNLEREVLEIQKPKKKRRGDE